MALLAGCLVAPSLALPARAAIVVAPIVGGVLLVLCLTWRRGANVPDDAEFRATHDALTSLPNRTLFDRRLAEAIADSKRHGTGAAVMVIDLDRFKTVNDTYGHPTGDRVLTVATRRLAASIRTCDTVARVGGDEFGVVLTGTDDEGALESALRMLESLGSPIHVDETTVTLGASIGIALHPEHGTTPSALVAAADEAMYEAKRAGIGHTFYDEAKASTTNERRRLAAELQDAVDSRQLCVHYQPRFDLRSDALAAVEALARWPHRKRGLLAAETFMPIAERHGLGTAISFQVLAQAAAQAARWQRSGLAVTVAVNVDARSLVDPTFPARVSRLLFESNAHPAFIELELSEGAFLTTLAQDMDVVPRLAELGMQIAVDDFGAGYSSLGRLAEIPVSKLKLHRSLVLRAVGSSREEMVLASTVELAHDLGLEVVAEGVEDSGYLEFVRSIGCDYAQGYYLGAPAPPAALHGEVAA